LLLALDPRLRGDDEEGIAGMTVEKVRKEPLPAGTWPAHGTGAQNLPENPRGTAAFPRCC
ncbi:hypothetical protein, partial [Acinetobacter baumannii]|uniref:hypothetical protein n=1 Tax=Acinetobacter baumannii TaxID=470 RepID=UPI0037D4E93D